MQEQSAADMDREASERASELSFTGEEYWWNVARSLGYRVYQRRALSRFVANVFHVGRYAVTGGRGRVKCASTEEEAKRVACRMAMRDIVQAGDAVRKADAEGHAA